MKLTKIIIITILFSLFSFQASALSFSNFTGNGTGSINTGNGYFDDPESAFGYTGTRNVYIIAEDAEAVLIEPISWVSGTTPTSYVLVNSTLGTLKDAVVHNGYVYFVEGTTLKKMKTRNAQVTCESNDTTAGGCISTISTNVGETIRVYDNVLYFTVGTNALKHLDPDDNVVSDFSIGIPPGAESQHNGLAITRNGSDITAYNVWFTGSNVSVQRCTSSGCVNIFSPNNNAVMFNTLYTTTNYIYSYTCSVGGVCTAQTEYLIRISNSTLSAIDYITTGYAHRNRVYVGSESTVGLLAQTSTSYETFNSNEAGVSSLPTSEGAGIVQYVDKEIIVPNPTYFNDSIIPFVISLRFIITAENHTNYQDSLFWHVIVDDPRGYEVYDLNLPAIACTQSDAWWDILSLFQSGDYTCDGSGTIDYTPAAGQFWLNGTWTVSLTEEIPGTISTLSSDTWVITNESANNSGVINPPPPCPTCGLGTGGTINTNTSLQIIQVFSYVAFWGFIIWLGVVFTVIGLMAKSPGGVNGIAVIVVAWLSAIFIALVGLFDPFKIYIIVLSTIIAAVLFRFGKNATTTED